MSTQFSKKNVKEQLKERGYDFTAEELEGGKECIKLKCGNNAGISFSLDDVIDTAEREGVLFASEVTDIIEDHIKFTKAFENGIKTENFRIGLQKKSKNNKNVVRDTEFEGIEQYVFCRNPEIGIAFKLPKGLLDVIGISEDEAFKFALENTEKETVITPLGEFLPQEFKADHPVEDLGSSYPQWIVTNENQIKGASAILDKEALKKFADDVGCHKFTAIPASIHEWILAPNEVLNIDDATWMVREVNRTTVLPSEILADRAYELEI